MLLRDHFNVPNINLQMMYMPMNAGHFHNDFFHEALLIFYPILIIIFSQIGARFLSYTDESNE